MSRTLPAIVIGAALLLGACGGSDDSDAGSDAPEFGPAEFGLTDAELNSRIDEAEASIADCMVAAGFDYVPVDAVTVREAMDADATLPGVSEEDYVAQYGFGITTVFEDPVLVKGRGEQNASTYAALTPADQTAYDRALFGGPGFVSLARALEDEDLSETGGCTLEAVKDLFDEDELNGSYVNPADEQIEEDSRMVAALEDWAECVQAEGFDYEHPDDITDELHERLDAILDGADPASLSGAAADALAELQGEERAVAVVAVECEEEHIIPVEEVVEAEIYGTPQP
jgi:hypothetical protein